MRHPYLSTLAIVVSLSISGCGVYTPKVGEAWEADYPGDTTRVDPNTHLSDPTPPLTSSGQLEFEIKWKVYCELRSAVAFVRQFQAHTTYKGVTTYEKWPPDDWGAQISLLMEVDENTSLNPGVSIITPFKDMATRTYGFGATLSSTASRIDKFNPYFSVAYLRDKNVAPWKQCERGIDPLVEGIHINPARSSLLLGDLGIIQWLTDSFVFNKALRSSSAPGLLPAHDAPAPVSGLDSGSSKSASPSATSKSTDGKGATVRPDTISIEVKFIVVSSGNVNPQWKLVRIGADTGTTPALGAGRTRTHDLAITIGPSGDPQTINASLSLQNGQTISAAIRNAIPTFSPTSQ